MDPMSIRGLSYLGMPKHGVRVTSHERLQFPPTWLFSQQFQACNNEISDLHMTSPWSGESTDDR